MKKAFVVAMLFAFAWNVRAAGVLYVKADATGAGDGSSWANAYTDFNAALAVALAANGAIDEIWVAGTMHAANNVEHNVNTELTIRGGVGGRARGGRLFGPRRRIRRRLHHQRRTLRKGLQAPDHRANRVPERIPQQEPARRGGARLHGVGHLCDRA